jgi:CRISPR-associated protein Csb2
MPSYFCVSVTFLDPAFHGRGDGGEPEWPPSPLRLFQALAAASAARWNERMRLGYAVQALRWLERQHAPTLVAARGEPSQVKYRLYVPDNVGDKVAGSWSRGGAASIADYRTEKDVRPTHLAGDAVHYLYPLTDGDPEFAKHRETLYAAARSITHLGWGIDMVAADALVISGEEAAKLPGERWRPADVPSTAGYRVPLEGTLQALIEKHEAFLNRVRPDGFNPVPPLSAFRVVGYRRVTNPPAHASVAFKLLHPEHDRFAWFPTTYANGVAAMTRHATAAAAKNRPKEWVDSYVHGHRPAGVETKPRFSYLPLPSIERRGARAHVVSGIRRVLLAELIEASESHLLWARQLLPGQFLIEEQSGKRRAMLAPLNEKDWVLQQYTRQSATWATVTPIVLPGSDDGRFAKAEKLFAKALRHAGYCPEAMAELEFRIVAFWPGGDLALRFQRPDYLKKDHWSVYHVCLRWKEAIKGPLALGAGRHCGLGVFAAVDD